jgi:hypothetical protein
MRCCRSHQPGVPDARLQSGSGDHRWARPWTGVRTGAGPAHAGRRSDSAADGPAGPKADAGGGSAARRSFSPCPNAVGVPPQSLLGAGPAEQSHGFQVQPR